MQNIILVYGEDVTVFEQQAPAIREKQKAKVYFRAASVWDGQKESATEVRIQSEVGPKDLERLTAVYGDKIVPMAGAEDEAKAKAEMEAKAKAEAIAKAREAALAEAKAKAEEKK